MISPRAGWLDRETTIGGWGEGVVARIADDLREATGGARGFSRRNLFYMRRFAALWPDAEKVPSPMAQIPWTAHRTLLDRFADEPSLYTWYATKAAENRWSVRHLSGQIDLKLHQPQGAALTNFSLAGRDETVAKLALHRVYAPIAVSTWQAGTPAQTLPPVEITDDVPADLEELSELETVRVRLIDRVTQHTPQIADDE